jgi:hypothetical protein
MMMRGTSHDAVAIAVALLALVAAPAGAQRIFNAVSPLPVTLTVPVAELRRDTGAEPPWRPARLTFATDSGGPRTIDMRVRARGIWRRNNCQFPPLRLDFARDSVRRTPFAALDRPKLVNYCQNTDRGEEYLLEEYQLYRIYQLLTDVSYRARLLRVEYMDSQNGRRLTTRYAMLVEEPQSLVERLRAKADDIVGVAPIEVDEESQALMSVFQYFIGNTDWSIPSAHNVNLLRLPGDSLLRVVPYDFDYAGAVNAHYALPGQGLPIRRVRERLYRGFCMDRAPVDKAIARLREQKPAIYALYSDEIGKLMRPQAVQEALSYFDEFFRIVDDPRRLQREILGACRPTLENPGKGGAGR